MNELMIFEGHEVEVFELSGKVLFNPYHVGICLEMAPGTVKDHMSRMNEKQVIKLKNSDVGLTNFRKLNNAGENFLTESGVYKLVFKSRKPSAEKFTDWVTDEVLPSIRKHGMYATDELINNPDLLIAVAQELKEEREKNNLLTQKIEQDKPKTIFADAVTASSTSILIGDLAKLLRQNGIQIGQHRLFEWLRNNGYLIKSGRSHNMPKQRYMEQGLFEVNESAIENPDKTTRIATTTKVTGKGQVYFINAFMSNEDKRAEIAETSPDARECKVSA